MEYRHYTGTVLRCTIGLSLIGAEDLRELIACLEEAARRGDGIDLSPALARKLLEALRAVSKALSDNGRRADRNTKKKER